MHLLQSGVNLVYIRDFLGHVDIQTTEVYARIDGEMKRKALEKSSLNVVSEKLP
jgi:site-specific recombinase XerD